MPCNRASSNKSFNRDQAGCITIPTNGKPCVCICENDDGDIMQCDDCKCFKSDTCQCKCDDSRCTCIVTKGADSICVSRDGRGNIKRCECLCADGKRSGCCTNDASVKLYGCCKKKPEKKACGGNCKCGRKGDFKESRRDAAKSYRCDKVGCVCIPTDGKSCVCICEDENGDIKRCDDCKCFKSSVCQCKCDDSRCTCIVTKGADCVCVCRDKHGNIKVCECCCAEDVERCCKKEVSGKPSGYCCREEEKKPSAGSCKCGGKRDFKEPRRDISFANYRCEKPECVCIPTEGRSCICVCEDKNGDIVRCDDCRCSKYGRCQCKCNSECTCILTNGADCICVCRDKRGNIKVCDCSCVEDDDEKCCKKEMCVKPYKCCAKEPEKKACGGNCKCAGKREFKSRRDKKYICEKPGCVCIPTDGRSCVCVCEDENGDIVRCDDCRCSKYGRCQCKCDDSKCTCIFTFGADCICVCRDKRGNIKICECSCVEDDRRCCKRNENLKLSCCSKELEQEPCCVREWDEKRVFEKPRRAVESGRKPRNDDIGCKNCKCCSEDFCCEKQPAKAVQNRNCGRNCVCADNKIEPRCCAPNNEESCLCCKNETNDKPRVSFKRESQCCSVKEKSCGCCRDDIREERKIYDDKQDCICTACVSRDRYNRFADDGCACVTKKTTKSCNRCC